jgi:Lar family restriction alleviation protein
MTQHPVTPQEAREALLPCPFCGSDNVSDGENLIESEALGVGRVTCKQSECLNCGACGPLSQPVKGPDYGDVAAIAAWNRRALAQQSPAAQGGAQQSEGENENAVERGGRHPVSIHEAIDVLRAVERDWVHPYDDAPFEDGEMPTMDRVRRLVKEDALFRVLLGIGA